ncbi:hypothetical protein [Streptomyces abikoensis]|uniref:Uncharacterized protein n=1 Tax=Streptomyces abikoensis TaxID=97398 RepID=A0ABW7TCD5_9ACTN
MGATETAKRWNGGRLGAARPGMDVQRLACLVEGCGTEAVPGGHRRWLIRVEVVGSREPARWYCRGWCASYGRALADVRAIGGAA